MSVLLPARRLGVVCLSVLLAACGGDSSDPVTIAPDPLAAYRAQTVQWRDCDPSILGQEGDWPDAIADRVSCADIRVPQDYAAPGGDDLSVAMLRVTAEQPDRKLGALFFNPGGPGGDGLGLAAHFGELWRNADPDDALGGQYRALSRRYDLIGFSPRGTGASSALICESNELTPQPAFHGDRSPDNVDTLLRYSELEARTCKKNPMAPYINTEQTVRDLDLMRHLVGEARLDYIGFSYGTWLGAWYAARFPDRVGRMLLDSNMNFTGDFSDASAGQVRSLQRVLDGIVAPYAARHPDRYGLGTSVDAIRDLFGRLPDPMKQLLSENIPLNTSDAVEDADGGARVHLRARGARQLGRDMRAGSEPVESEPPARPQVRPAERAIPDDSRTEKGCDLGGIAVRRQRVDERLGRRCEGRVTAVRIPPGVAGGRTQVLASLPAPPARAAGAAQPRHTDAMSHLQSPDRRPGCADDSNDLMTGYHPRAVHGQFLVDDVQIGATDAARLDLDQHLLGGGLRDAPRGRLEHAGSRVRTPCGHSGRLLTRPSHPTDRPIVHELRREARPPPHRTSERIGGSAHPRHGRPAVGEGR